MKTTVALPMLVAGSVMLSGCFDGSSSSNRSTPPAPTAQVRVIHASPDAPRVNVLVNGEAAVEGADYKQAALLTPAPGDYEIAVEGILPGGTETVIGPANFSFNADVRYNIVAINEVATIAPLVFVESEPSFSSTSEARLMIGHLAPNAPAVDIYVTAAGEGNDLSVVDPLLPNVAFETVTEEPAIVPAGEYRIQITVAGNSTAVFDSGDVTIPAGADLFIGAVQNTGANVSVSGSSPVSLIVVNGGDVSEIYDVDQGAGFRVVHASSGAGAGGIEVRFDGSTRAAIQFGVVTPNALFDGYFALPAGETNFSVVDIGTTEPVLIDENSELVNGQGYTAFVLGELNIEGLIERDDARRIATQASLRIVHGSTSAGNVDIYLLPGGQRDIGNSQATLSDVPFKAVTEYLAVAQGSYDIRITPAGTGTVAIAANDVSLSANSVYTVVARDGKPGVASPLDDLGLILFDDFVQP